MRWACVPSVALACLLAVWPALARAHSFSTPYVLPIPYWMYVYGCAATLIVTFAVLAIFMRGASPTEPVAQSTRFDPGAGTRSSGRRMLMFLRAGALVALLMTIIGGVVGSEDPASNVSLRLFWVVFLLGGAYLTALVGDLYPFVNPWWTLVNGLERTGVPLSTARLRYPAWLGCWPAGVGYLGLVWVELFVVQTPRGLTTMLLAYTALTLLGVTLFGKRDWFERADVFSMFFRILGKMAPVSYVLDEDDGIREVRFRRPFSGLLSEPAPQISVLLFVLFMLSSTAYDGIYDTQQWTALFWKNMLVVLQPWGGEDLGNAQAVLMDLFLVYRHVGLLVFPFLYLIVFFATLVLAKSLTHSTRSLHELALQFTNSLVPIAFAYHFAHYYTFLIVQFRELPALFAKLFGSEVVSVIALEGLEGPATGALDVGIVWHTQVVAILLGHVVSVVLAHYEALRAFPGLGCALLGQAPLLVLMVTYTLLGLWILTLPLA